MPYFIRTYMDYHSNNYQWKHLVLAQLSTAISQCKIWSGSWILNLYLPSQPLTPTSVLFEPMTFKSKCYFHIWMSYPWRDSFCCFYTQYLFICLYSLFHFLWKAFAWKTELCFLHMFLLLLPLRPPELSSSWVGIQDTIESKTLPGVQCTESAEGGIMLL